MAAISSTYKDPSDSFIWWIEGDRIAIATLTGDANTRETSRSSYKAVQLGVSTSYQADGSTDNDLGAAINDTTGTSITVEYATGFSANDLIKVDDEIMKVVSVTNSTTIVVVRGYHNTTAATHVDATLIYELDVITDGFVISYYAEPDKLAAINSSTSIDIDNALQPLLIDYVKGQALLDEAVKQKDPNTSQIKATIGEKFLANFREGLRKFGAKKNDKIGGTRAVVPANLK
jgi:hypothetical protein